MQDLKIRVKSEDESKEVQELLFELGVTWFIFSRDVMGTDYEFLYVSDNYLGCGTTEEYYLQNNSKEITVDGIRDMVVLERNSITDATHEDGGNKFYKTKSGALYHFFEGVWVHCSPFTVESKTFKPIKKLENESKQDIKKYLTRNINGDYFVVDYHLGFDIDQLILIPEGAEIAIMSNKQDKVYFWKDKGSSIFVSNEWCDSIQYMTSDMFKQIWKDHKVVWQDMSNEITENNVQIDFNKLKVEWFEKFLNGVKVQYRIGVAVGSETSQWCNMTYNSLKNLQHSPIEFREAPKYVVLNGITFKDKESLLRHIANNYNLD